jgi:hypothetical protein
MRFLGILLLSVLVVALFSLSAYADAPAAPAAAATPAAPVAATIAPVPPPPAHTVLPPIVRNICPATILTLPPNAVLGALAPALNLTEDQKPALMDAQDKFQAKIVGLSTTVQAATKQLVEAIAAADTTPEKLKELTSNASKADADVLHARVEFWGVLKGLLTPDQYKIVARQPMIKIDAPYLMSPGGFPTPRTGEAPVTPPPTPPAAAPKP